MIYWKTENKTWITEYSSLYPISRIEYIQGEYSPELDRDTKGELTVYYRDGSVIEHKIYIDLYVRQFGFSISLDGTTLFIPSWEGRLKAIDINSGKVKWRSVKGSGRVIVDNSYIYCLSREKTLYKLNIANGNIVDKTKGYKDIYDISPGYLLSRSAGDRWIVISKEDLTVIESFINDDMLHSPIMDVFAYNTGLYVLEASCNQTGVVEYHLKSYSVLLHDMILNDIVPNHVDCRIDCIRCLYKNGV